MIQICLSHQDEESRRSVAGHHPQEIQNFDEEGETDESDADDFIVDDDGNPLEKKKRTRRIFNDAHLQEGQDIFGVDFDYDEFEKYDEDSYGEESEGEDEYEEEGGDIEKERRPRKGSKKKTAKKSIFEIYEPSELKRGHFTDLDNEVNCFPKRASASNVPKFTTNFGFNYVDS